VSPTLTAKKNKNKKVGDLYKSQTSSLSHDNRISYDLHESLLSIFWGPNFREHTFFLKYL
jgi:hypothetical protein